MLRAGSVGWGIDLSFEGLKKLVDVGAGAVGLAIALPLPLISAASGSASGQLALAATLSLAVGLAAAVMLRRVSLSRLRDATDRQQAESLRFHTALENISQGLCFFDGEQRLIVCNQRYARMYGLTAEQVKPGTTLRQIVDHRFAAGTCPDMTREDYLEWRKTIAVSATPSDTIARLKDGRIFAIHHEPMPDRGWVATHEDVTDRRRAQARIEHMARSDSLTGLANRVEFREQLNQALASGGGDPVAVLFIDLDRFKAVNDSLGHPVGDQLLRAAAQRLGVCVRQGDLVARLGGDEFAIVQVRADATAARSLADRLVRAISQPFEIDEHRVQVGASVGVVLSPDDGNDPDDLLKKADLALYAAKAAGRGVHRFFDPDLVEQAQGRRALEIDLRQALAESQLELHYQPIFGLTPLHIIGVEALLRWRHPQRGLVMPDCFIPLAEEVGLIEPLGEWVIREALTQAVNWPPHIGIAINLSPVQVAAGGLLSTVAAALRDSAIDPRRVEFEITESVRLDEDSANLAVLRSLRSLGVRISLDDFGVGYASLSYLRSFPFDKIKIDRSFVRDVTTSVESAAIVSAITLLGKHLSVRVTAEGVEEQAQLDRLIALGCDEAQGYHLGRPQPLADLQRLLVAESLRRPSVVGLG
jgi:diguanylate cyclase (GGDEF)-like protein/PAS domain S-box-containing protein